MDALDALGTDEHKPYLEHAPWIIAILGQRKGGIQEDEAQQNYYVPGSLGIEMGILISALHHAGLCMLTRTPKPMTFLHDLCGRPKSEKPYLLLVVGYPAEGATVPVHALEKNPLKQIASFICCGKPAGVCCARYSCGFRLDFILGYLRIISTYLQPIYE
ncbi:nitroreductase family protein [Altererythrobacter lutimaris]|uniref:Nitroreductase domain-containing protein n=1 Tax=Altererythrobacter lutimaris TaxID=2743979 RepID=A0A850H6Q0_9SPHN|nr:hypothetical protein [Altererythrobacter lutimaris]NVE93449.1 hypothetical protein [Altererythrobacter lutimaris]